MSLAVAAGPATRPGDKPPVVGDTPAEFSLDALDGTTVKSADLLKAGPVVVLQLRGWVGYQCPICTKQVGEFIAEAREFKAAGATVVLVYPGPAEDLKKHADDFVSGKGLPDEFKFVLDPDLTFVKSWGLRWDKAGETAYPSTFVLDKAGKVTFAKVSHDHAHRATAAQVLAVLKK